MELYSDTDLEYQNTPIISPIPAPTIPYKYRRDTKKTENNLRCFNCGKSGHKVAFCRASKRSSRRSLSPPQRKRIHEEENNSPKKWRRKDR